MTTPLRATDAHKIAETCACAAHEVNNIYNAAIGDTLAPPWDELTDAQRNSAIAGVKHALAGGTPEDSHNLWLESRRAEEWTYGPVKSFTAKTSPFKPSCEPSLRCSSDPW